MPDLSTIVNDIFQVPQSIQDVETEARMVKVYMVATFAMLAYLVLQDARRR